MHKCIIFAIFAANFSEKVQTNSRKRGFSYPDKYKQLKNNITSVPFKRDDIYLIYL